MMKPMTRYLALLRGINVGGNNIIKMSDLKVCFESLGFGDVATYIQSGNVLFTSDESNKTSLTERIELKLSESFDYKSRIVLVTQRQLEMVMKGMPEGFSMAPDVYRYDVIFLKEPLTPVEAMKSFRLREGVDNAYQGDDVIYITRLISKAGQSYLNKIIILPVYQNMTIQKLEHNHKALFAHQSVNQLAESVKMMLAR